MTLNKTVNAGQILLLLLFFMLTMAAAPKDGEDKAGSLIKKLESKNRNTRAHAATELGKIKDARATAPLINALKDTDAYVREQAAWSLGELKDAQAVQPLINVLKNDDYIYVRQESARALGKLRDSQAVQPLIAVLNDESPDIREDAVKALIEIGAPVAEHITRALKDNDLKTVADVYYYLISIGNPEMETVLIKALDKYGSKRMALDFMYCENMRLKEAAYEWAKHHDYKIDESAEVKNGLKWKRF